MTVSQSCRMVVRSLRVTSINGFDTIEGVLILHEQPDVPPLPCPMRPEPNPVATTANSPAPQSITFGCRLNTYESEVMVGLARAGGHSDTVIVNTCAVTKEAERTARRAIRKLRRERPDTTIIVTGCAAQINPGQFAEMAEVDRVIGNAEKMTDITWQPEAADRVVVNDIMAVTETASHLLPGFETRTRAFVQIQNGCDHRCTFCVIPYGRGNSRSVPIGAVVRQVRHLVESGAKEVVLTGVDLTSYGADLPGRPTLGQMMRRLLALVPDLPRLRLSSVDVVEIDEDLWRLIAEEPRLMPHLHLSLQAGDDLILKRMKRRHLRADAIALTDRARRLRPEMVFGADLIVGFPTETDAMFENTLAAVQACDLTYLHVFPYSERPGTPAARMPPVDPAVRKARASRLRDVGAQRLNAYLTSRVGQWEHVLTEKGNTGHTPGFAPVRFTTPVSAGDVLLVRVIGVEDGALVPALVCPDGETQRQHKPDQTACGMT